MDLHARALDIHARYPAIDGHADSLWRYLDRPDAFFGDAREGHLDSRRLRETGQNVQVMAVYTPPEKTGLEALQYALDYIHGINAVFDSPRNAELRPPHRRILTAADLRGACRPGEYGFLVFMEGASPLRGSMKNLDLFHRLGVRGITLTHNHDNEAARGCFAEGTGRGLTAFGRELVREMDRRGMVVDLAHSNEDTFWETLAIARGPVIDSHTALRKFRDFPRNLGDDQLEAIAKSGGVACINFIPDHHAHGIPWDCAHGIPWDCAHGIPWDCAHGIPWDSASRPEPKEPMGVDFLVRVIGHAVERAGIMHVGLGADWDGFEKPIVGLEDCAGLPHLTEALLAAGYGEADIAALLGGNLLRVLGSVLPRD